ncbi:hypothetical protein GGS24DRAFT_25960 [Hypoxylon argillaceum]|nr:hypothetical protein GGS24DRAFT_25960 [Hypoxylon argillaceum]KAI1148457.1 hypothetical protein F4825DRAFT_100603 [Nemania diffusa]
MSSLRVPILRSAPLVLPRRLLHRSAARRLPYKDDADRESLKPRAHENTQSGTDDEVGRDYGAAAFDPRKTSPEREQDTAARAAAQKGKANPLGASPADHDFAKGGRETEGQPQRGKTKKSGGGGAPKEN